MKRPFLPTMILLLFFVLAQIIGLLVIDNYLVRTVEGVEWTSLPSVMGIGVERPEIGPQQTVWTVMIVIVLGTLFFLGIIKFKFFRLIKIWFFLALLLCLHISFGSFLPSIIAFFLALILAFFKIFKNNFYVHNLAELFIYGGLSAIFVPLLNIKTAFVLLILISLYDAYAVWKSKHMITLAKAQAEQGLFAGLVFPHDLKLRKNYSKLKLQNKNGKLQTTNYQPRTMSVAILGGGDVSFPLIFNGTVLVSYGFLNALFLVPFSTVALACLFYFGNKQKFYPAMPFISAGCFIGYLFLWLFLL